MGKMEEVLEVGDRVSTVIRTNVGKTFDSNAIGTVTCIESGAHGTLTHQVVWDNAGWKTAWYDSDRLGLLWRVPRLQVPTGSKAINVG